jgi:hypothetical protein
MNQKQDLKASPLDLEVKEVERRRRPGCNSSSTHPTCTCPILFAPDQSPKH